MDSAFAELLLLVPPPVEPNSATGDWTRIEQDLGFTLPADYKHFITHYGSGRLCTLFEICSPFALEQFYKKTVREAWISWTGVYHCWGEEPEGQIPFPYFRAFPA